MASRVGDDHMGRFLTETLAAEGCDVSHVSVDPDRLTALVLLGIQDRGHLPPRLLPRELRRHGHRGGRRGRGLHRLGPRPGGHRHPLLHRRTHRISTLALDRARRNGVRTVLDIDYRPVLWGVAGPGAGAQRFVPRPGDRPPAGDPPRFDLVLGTEDEFRIAGGSDDLLASLHGCGPSPPATLVVKLGPAGCAVVEGPIPDRWRTRSPSRASRSR